jgi:hypothetical protein
MLPRITLRNGRAVPLEAVERLGRLLAHSPSDCPDAELAAVHGACAPESLADFAWALCERWLQSDAPSRDKWALHALGHIGGDHGARRLATLIPEWPTVRAGQALEVLGMVGSDVALTYAKRIGEKAKSKSLRERVERVMEDASGARGLTRDELEDRMVPDLGLVEGARVLDYGPRQFRVAFDAQLKAFATDEKGGRLARLPKPGKADDLLKAEAAQREWKALKGDAELIGAVQLKRLEAAMCARRRWKEKEFRFLLGHPLLGRLAQRIVWEAGDRTGAVLGTFRVAEDASLAGMDDKPFGPEGFDHARIPHPLELTPAAIDKWRGIFSDYEIVEPFAQLTRSFYSITPEERDSATCNRVKGATASPNRLMGIRHRGWKGGWEYGGDLMKKFEGTPLWVSLAVTPPDTLGVATLSETIGEAPSHSRPFGELDPILFSEMVRDLEWLKATGA